MADGIVVAPAVIEKRQRRADWRKAYELKLKVDKRCIQCGLVWAASGRGHRGKSSGLCKRCSALKAARVKSELYALRRIAAGVKLLGVTFKKDREQGQTRRRFWSPKKVKKKRASKLVVVVRAVCRHCGKDFEHPAKKPTLHCTRQCMGRDIYESRKRKQTRARRCVVCDVEFSPIPSHFRTTTCSVECLDVSKRFQHHDQKRRRRLKLGAAVHSISVMVVFRRDKWQCQSCGCSTPKSLRGTLDDNAPELDHVIPVSKGGGHTLDNLQCLCRLCNQLKGVMDMDEFMSLHFKRAS
jgi:5-methylcytosine-specific restriction endonuclease McrA